VLLGHSKLCRVNRTQSIV